MIQSGFEQLGPRSSDRVKAISLIKEIALVVYLLIIFEGALRKWVLPGFSGPLFFVKDPFVLSMYFIAFKYKLFPDSAIFRGSFFLALLFLFLGLLQTILNNINPFLLFIGMRNYFFLMPMAFLLATYINENDLIRLARITCLVAVPVTFLVYFQYNSTPEDYINKNVGLNEATRVFTVAQGIVRPSGTFSFTTGQSQFTLFLVGFLFFNFFLPSHKKFLNSLLFAILIVCALMLITMGGSRGLIADVAILAFFMVLFSFLSIEKKSSFRIIGSVFLGAIITYFLANTFFADNLNVLEGRFEKAAASEDTIYRFFHQYIEFLDVLGFNIPIWGTGLGSGSNAGAFLMTGARTFQTAEAEWLSIMIESGPIMGFVYILYRVVLSFKTLYKSFIAFKIGNTAVPVIFSAMVFMSFLGGQMTKQGTELFYGWFFIGVAMAANRVYYYREVEFELSKSGIETLKTPTN